jgi:hypothetical protein
MSSDITIHDTEEGIKGSKKRCEQRLQTVTTMTNNDDTNGEKVGGSGVVCIMTVVGSSKC